MNREILLKEKISELPRVRLGALPTPLVRLDRLSEEFDVDLYIKRDDQIGRNPFAGNKVRKLEFLLGQALEEGCDTVFTYGATQSNHAMQTAALAKLGLPGGLPASEIYVERQYWLPGYEKPSPEANNAIRHLARTEGILTDPVYSGKGFYGLLDHLQSGKIPPKSTVVFWHTGGIAALFAEKEILGDLAF